METNGMVTEKEAQQLLKVGRTTLYIWRKKGKIQYVKYGNKSYRYPIAEIERIMQAGI